MTKSLNLNCLRLQSKLKKSYPCFQGKPPIPEGFVVTAFRKPLLGERFIGMGSDDGVLLMAPKWEKWVSEHLIVDESDELKSTVQSTSQAAASPEV